MVKKLAFFAVLACSSALCTLAQDLPQTSANSKLSKYDLSRIGHRGIGSGLNTYSLDREVRLGRSMAADVLSEARLQNDPLVNSYVRALVNRLVSHSDATIPFTIKIIDSDEINAFSLPGGFLFINTGLILAAEDEAQLAGVLSHEIAHVAARHMTRARTRRFLLDAVSIPLSFTGPGVYGAAFISPLSSLKFNRDAEREADLLGLQYMYSAGYDPSEFLRFFETLAGTQAKVFNPRILRFLASEPGDQERLKAITNIVASQLPARADYIMTTNDFEAARARLFELGNYSALKDDSGSVQPRLRRPTAPNVQPAPKSKPQTVPKLPPMHSALLPAPHAAIAPN